MFETLEAAPPDAILGLTEAFNKDPNPNKINLGVGVYKDEHGKTPIPACVKQAEERLISKETTKSYLPIQGAAEYAAAVQRLLFGADHDVVQSGRGATAHTPGGTGALRVAADFIKRVYPEKRLWLSEPTWANHPNVFSAAGVDTCSYPYYDASARQLDFDAMLAALKGVPEGDLVLLHGCCHNPTGMDPSAEQWRAIADVAAERRFVPLIDFAYQGLADGIEEDAAGLRTMCNSGCDMLVANSFSKNFGLYRERVGALTVIADSQRAAENTLSHIKKCIRANYSNPPAHGAAIVATVLEEPGLRTTWNDEVKTMRDRINGMRRLFVETLAAKGVRQDFSFITSQRGMFSFSGLNKDQVAALRDKYAIYVVGSGRINVAGMTEANMDYLCRAIADVLGG